MTTEIKQSRKSAKNGVFVKGVFGWIVEVNSSCKYSAGNIVLVETKKGEKKAVMLLDLVNNSGKKQGWTFMSHTGNDANFVYTTFNGITHVMTNYEYHAGTQVSIKKDGSFCKIILGEKVSEKEYYYFTDDFYDEKGNWIKEGERIFAGKEIIWTFTYPNPTNTNTSDSELVEEKNPNPTFKWAMYNNNFVACTHQKGSQPGDAVTVIANSGKRSEVILVDKLVTDPEGKELWSTKKTPRKTTKTIRNTRSNNSAYKCTMCSEIDRYEGKDIIDEDGEEFYVCGDCALSIYGIV